MSFKKYPVQKMPYHVENYAVAINGEPVCVDTARTSAVPFNRRWPGHQRQIEQTELINFVSFSCSGETVLEIKPKEAFTDYVIRPLNLGFKHELTADGTIKIYITKPAYFTVEPYGRANALHIFADPETTYDVNPEDENVLYFGPGEHEVGLITMQSNQTVFIDEGAVVYACIVADDCENLKVLGRGILDNSHNKEKILFEVNAENNNEDVGNAQRTHTIRFNYCKNIEVEGITIRDSLVYNMKPVGCTNFNVSNVKIIGCWRFNSDGIDMHNCVGVHLNNCFLRTYDDSICVKGFDLFMAADPAQATYEAIHHNGGCYDVFKDVLVENCVIWNDWGKCLEIGAETRATEISNIVFRNNSIIHVSGGSLTCSNGDNAHVSDLHYENITIEYDENIPPMRIQKNDDEVYVNDDPDNNPALISVGIYYFAEYSRGSNVRGRNNGIYFKNIHLFGRHKPIAHIIGFDADHLSENIVIEDFFWNEKRVTPQDLTVNANEFVKNVTLDGEKII